MITNHPRFMEAITEQRKVSIRYFSLPDNGVLDRVCAPLDYGPGGGAADAAHRYWVWDYQAQPGLQVLSLAPQQIVDLQKLGVAFDPAEFVVPPWPWAVPRAWSSPAQQSPPPPAAVGH